MNFFPAFFKDVETIHVQVPKHSCRSQGLEAQNYYFLYICNLVMSHCFWEFFFF